MSECVCWDYQDPHVECTCDAGRDVNHPAVQDEIARKYKHKYGRAMPTFEEWQAEMRESLFGLTVYTCDGRWFVVGPQREGEPWFEAHPWGLRSMNEDLSVNWRPIALFDAPMWVVTLCEAQRKEYEDNYDPTDAEMGV